MGLSEHGGGSRTGSSRARSLRSPVYTAGPLPARPPDNPMFAQAGLGWVPSLLWQPWLCQPHHLGGRGHLPGTALPGSFPGDKSSPLLAGTSPCARSGNLGHPVPARPRAGPQHSGHDVLGAHGHGCWTLAEQAASPAPGTQSHPPSWHRASQPSGRCSARMLSPSLCLCLGQEVPVLVLPAPPRQLCIPPEPTPARKPLPAPLLPAMARAWRWCQTLARPSCLCPAVGCPGGPTYPLPGPSVTPAPLSGLTAPALAGPGTVALVRLPGGSAFPGRRAEPVLPWG